MVIERAAIKKWTIITIICGAHSFFWGYMGTSSVLPMALGMLTLILMFSTIESHPYYKERRAADPLAAQALDLALKIRVIIAFYIPLSTLLQSFTVIPFLFSFPALGEIWLGMGATMVTKLITGIDLMQNSNRNIIQEHNLFLAVYVATIITGILHTIFLALLSCIVWSVLKVRKDNS
jgi:hypothetical protein